MGLLNEYGSSCRSRNKQNLGLTFVHQHAKILFISGSTTTNPVEEAEHKMLESDGPFVATRGKPITTVDVALYIYRSITERHRCCRDRAQTRDQTGHAAREYV